MSVSHTAGKRLFFITGTDTSVGKTLLTCLLVTHLRRLKVPAIAIKPFCSGNRADAELLHDLQQGELTLDQVNPFFFPEPLAPMVAARMHRKSIDPKKVIAYVHSVLSRLPQSPTHNQKSGNHPSILLIEGVGGLLVPLAPGYFVLDLIRDLRCEVIVVSRNILGTLNHTLLAVHALVGACGGRRVLAKPGIHRSTQIGVTGPKIVLMEQERNDLSAASNPGLLAELLAPASILKLPFFHGNLHRPDVIRAIEKKVEKTLARILD